MIGWARKLFLVVVAAACVTAVLTIVSCGSVVGTIALFNFCTNNKVVVVPAVIAVAFSISFVFLFVYFWKNFK